MSTRTLKTPAVPPRANLADEVAERLRVEVISGKLAPGAVVAEIPTAARFGVSRVPVREATLVLEREGLLVFDERGWCRVRGLKARDLSEICDVRVLLECEIFRLAATHRRGSHLVRMERNIADMRRAKSLSRVTLLDIEFHDVVADASRHARLAGLWAIMRGQIQLFTAVLQRHQQVVTTTVRESTVAGHLELVKFLRESDGPGAAACIERHLLGWREFIQVIRELEQAEAIARALQAEDVR
jgi:DNA-binding GntR family transcriptional regulator